MTIRQVDKALTVPDSVPMITTQNPQDRRLDHYRDYFIDSAHQPGFLHQTGLCRGAGFGFFE